MGGYLAAVTIAGVALAPLVGRGAEPEPIAPRTEAGLLADTPVSQPLLPVELSLVELGTVLQKVAYELPNNLPESVAAIQDAGIKQHLTEGYLAAVAFRDIDPNDTLKVQTQAGLLFRASSYLQRDTEMGRVPKRKLAPPNTSVAGFNACITQSTIIRGACKDSPFVCSANHIADGLDCSTIPAMCYPDDNPTTGDWSACRQNAENNYNNCTDTKFNCSMEHVNDQYVCANYLACN